MFQERRSRSGFFWFFISVVISIAYPAVFYASQDRFEQRNDGKLEQIDWTQSFEKVGSKIHKKFQLYRNDIKKRKEKTLSHLESKKLNQELVTTIADYFDYAITAVEQGEMQFFDKLGSRLEQEPGEAFSLKMNYQIYWSEAEVEEQFFHWFWDAHGLLDFLEKVDNLDLLLVKHPPLEPLFLAIDSFAEKVTSQSPSWKDPLNRHIVKKYRDAIEEQLELIAELEKGEGIYYISTETPKLFVAVPLEPPSSYAEKLRSDLETLTKTGVQLPVTSSGIGTLSVLAKMNFHLAQLVDGQHTLTKLGDLFESSELRDLISIESFFMTLYSINKFSFRTESSEKLDSKSLDFLGSFVKGALSDKEIFSKDNADAIAKMQRWMSQAKKFLSCYSENLELICAEEKKSINFDQIRAEYRELLEGTLKFEPLFRSVAVGARQSQIPNRDEAKVYQVPWSLF